MKQTGKFITIEGQDGAGKSSNMDAICSVLAERNIEFVKTREPGGTILGEKIRELILGKEELKIDQLPELLLMFAARAQHLSEKIEPNLAAGKWVICDRFTDATLAYQGAGRGVDENLIKQLAEMVQQSREPDLTILLDVPVDVGEQRVTTRQEDKDRFETQEQPFKQRVRDKYLEIAKQHSNRVRLIDASQPLAEVTKMVQEQINEFCDHE